VKLGIVGSAADKFTVETELAARVEIDNAIRHYGATTIISGRCLMGGVDIWAEEAAERLKIKTQIYPPAIHSWSGRGGYRWRDMKSPQPPISCSW